MKIAIGQIEVKAGHFKENYEKIVEYVDKAKAENVDLIVFPEMCISGYMLNDKFLDYDVCNEITRYNDLVKDLSDGIGIIFGSLYHGTLENITKGRDGRLPRFNTAFFAYNRKWVKHIDSDRFSGMYIKHLNPDYRFFDDSRYFLSASELNNYDNFDSSDLHKVFIFKGKKIGLEICEDLWSDDYGIDISKYYASQQVDYIINISSSPYTINKEKGRIKQIKKHLEEYEIPYFVYCNVVGMQNNGKNILTFDGDSAIYTKDGNCIFNLNDAFEEELGIYDGKEYIAKRVQNKLFTALIKAIRAFDEQMFNKKTNWIIGMSGGLDSSISCALLASAISHDRIYTYNMATKHNSSATKNNAALLTKALGLELNNGEISELVEATKNVVMKQYGYKEEDVSGLTLENIQARIRGHLLSTFAAIHHGVVCNNGNKVEVALGYCTLYGDSIGALSILGDLLKTDLFELGYQINDYYGKEVIPYSLLPVVKEDKIEWEMPPSAELKDNQYDPMKWFYHDELVRYLTTFPTFRVTELMERYLNNELQNDAVWGRWIKYYHLDNGKAFIDDLEWVLRQIKLSVFKRIQMPPIITISRGAFGNDYRENQIAIDNSEKYEKLKAQIIEKYR